MGVTSNRSLSFNIASSAYAKMQYRNYLQGTSFWADKFSSICQKYPKCALVPNLRAETTAWKLIQDAAK